MPRGGGGARGGRGGARGGRQTAASAAQWGFDDPNVQPDGRPVELFPPYSVPVATLLSRREARAVDCYLLVREQVHSGPMYTRGKGAWEAESGSAGAYGQEQINERYGVHNKATVNAFLAMGSYSQRFEKPERTLPDLSARPFSGFSADVVRGNELGVDFYKQIKTSSPRSCTPRLMARTGWRGRSHGSASGGGRRWSYLRSLRCGRRMKFSVRASNRTGRRFLTRLKS
jgi:hypothetical protein